MYRIAICDDDIAYTEYLEKKIKEVLGKSERSSICKYYSGEEFIGDLELEFDLVFLDMQMGEIDGITAAIKFRKRNQDAVLVFCTGIQLPQPEFFDVQPFRYLMKNYTENKMDEELKNIINKMIENKKEVYIVVRNDGRMDKIAIDNIHIPLDIRTLHIWICRSTTRSSLRSLIRSKTLRTRNPA
ncbi:MAG: LytR/AlgR family response regulator transcription factor [Mediterraneibacter faecis]